MSDLLAAAAGTPLDVVVALLRGAPRGAASALLTEQTAYSSTRTSDSKRNKYHHPTALHRAAPLGNAVQRYAQLRSAQLWPQRLTLRESYARRGVRLARDWRRASRSVARADG